ncbi:MAG: class I SAM-dependent methyltransferase [Candidatus Portnoybacteria bacterium]|nr:class I SAM-dependent methyltransferase [Candidatus Portnoybacteria bacterium]
MVFGAPFVPSNRETVKKMIILAGVKPAIKAADLGSGDGRIVIALAKAGAEAHGYEINPLLVWWSRRRIRKEKLRGKAFIHWGSFWRHDLSSFDVITIFGISYIMRGLEKKLKEELKAGARVVSNEFIFPGWLSLKKDGGVYLYEKDSQ